MAFSSNFLSFSFIFLFLSCSFACTTRAHGLRREAVEENSNVGTSGDLVKVSSLLPSSDCVSAIQGNEGLEASLRVVDRYGPCHQDGAVHVNHTHILLQDPTISSAGNYLVTVGLGTPQRNLSLILDTGSSLTAWAKCQPAVATSESSTFKNSSCDSLACKWLESVPSIIATNCFEYKCFFAIEFVANLSLSAGSLASDTLTIGSHDGFDKFNFGCVSHTQRLLGSSDGILGLGDEDNVSFLSQTAQKYHKSFSYCIPSKASTGHLTFGKGSNLSATSFQYTPLTVNPNTNLYSLNMEGLLVDDGKLPIPPVVLNSSTIIDTGTMISRLPPAAYLELRRSFRMVMSPYPLTKPLGFLDTCYDFSSFEEVEVPVITLTLGGSVNMNLPYTNFLYIASETQVCLAFAPNTDEETQTILGTHQQKTFNISYDILNGLLGFAPHGCS